MPTERRIYIAPKKPAKSFARQQQLFIHTPDLTVLDTLPIDQTPLSLKTLPITFQNPCACSGLNMSLWFPSTI